MWNLLSIPIGILIVDHAFKIIHKSDKTGALLWKFAIRSNRTKCVAKTGRVMTGWVMAAHAKLLLGGSEHFKTKEDDLIRPGQG